MNNGSKLHHATLKRALDNGFKVGAVKDGSVSIKTPSILKLGRQTVKVEDVKEQLQTWIDSIKDIKDKLEAERLERLADKGVRQVVPDKYKEAYRAKGMRDNCGDWLADWMLNRFITDSDTYGFDHVAFRECMKLNGVDMTGKWASLPTSGQAGWQGRYRMNGRQKLQKLVAQRGYVLCYDDAGEELRTVLPVEALLELSAKHTSVKCEWTIEDDEVVVQA